MFARLIQLCSAFLLAFAPLASSPALAGNDGIITQILQRDRPIQAGSGCGHHAPTIGIADLLGTQFITANANAWLDWPVRLLVYENEKGEVWTAYTDFDWIARRHGIENRKDQFKMASSVISSITSSVKTK
jgi:hypothetical protein